MARNGKSGIVGYSILRRVWWVWGWWHRNYGDNGGNDIILQFKLLTVETVVVVIIRFLIYKSSVIPKRLADKYSNILTYTGIGYENPSERISIAISNNKIYAKY